MEPLGRVAYEAYRQYVASNAERMDNPQHLRYAGWLSHTEWEDLDPVMREAWEHSAQSVTAEL